MIYYLHSSSLLMLMNVPLGPNLSFGWPIPQCTIDILPRWESTSIFKFRPFAMMAPG
uniref:Uncharacterized protein n=1 Tax=Arundo donax TaxID=35708 RepID=A0A0A8Z4P3_ARUDO